MPLNVVCAIIHFGDKILVTQRSDKMSMPLKWEFPGGKIEMGENDTESLTREILEEINIEITILTQLEASVYDYPTFTINLIPFMARYVSGEIKLAEHEAYQLLNIDELSSLEWAEADLPIVKQLMTISGFRDGDVNT